ncbi:glycerophosphodiester phosphodiesterase family protein [Dongia sedimenti]|uniref:Glycerophosphodiester phosphodiesterase family protein n=1 Tax=Dongia sedimenti TaxID=3064282 RepID=A0ABU0YTL9_9PROT|nr:glycerophosphodiester phosphodiesterase family protein [Rhodospirillaceae bacterium R-7]
MVSSRPTYVEYIADPARSCAIVAHRGVWATAPENSLLAIETAIEAGYEVVEIDVRRSADGEFFLLHDDTLERMASLNLVPEQLSLEQLSRLRLRDRDGGVANRVTDQKIPSLKEVFALTRDRIFLDLDIKDNEMLPDVIACARAMGVADQVDFKADLKTRQDLAWILAAMEPHRVPFMAKTHLEASDADLQLELLFGLAPFMCEISFARLDQLADRKRLFREAGIALWVNTLDAVSSAGFTDTAARDDPEGIWGRLIDAGVLAIQTDYPDRLRALLDRRMRREAVGKGTPAMGALPSRG